MFKKCLYVVAVAVLFVGACGAIAGACDDDYNDTIDNGTKLHQKILLRPTVDAPAGAIGKADLEVENEHGMSRSEFEVETKGLLPGEYTVTITNKSEGASFLLGVINVTAEVHDDDDTYDNDSDHHHGRSDHHNGGYDHHHGRSDHHDCRDNHTMEDENDFDCRDNTTESEDAFAIPDGLALTDLGTLSIADSNSVVMLRGSFDNITDNITDNTTHRKRKIFAARSSLIPGIAGPDVSGQAFIKAITMKNNQRGTFLLFARKAPADTTLNISVNGYGVGNTRSNKRGWVIVHRLPWINLPTVKSIVATDSNGNTVFSANF
jgi:hypothetical protein